MPMTDPRVELIYDLDCPHVPAARAQLMRAFALANVQPRWREWDRAAPESPAYARDYGSPTILVDGRDVTGAEPSSGNDCCRLYRDDEGRTCPAPDVPTIAAALRAAAPEADAHAALPVPEPAAS